MNKIISMFMLLAFSSTAVAQDYKSDIFEKYGYAAIASTMYGTELKGGLRGSNVALNSHRENYYYPGFTVSSPKNHN